MSRRQCATALSQRAAQTAQRIKASPFFQTLAGAGAIPGCRGATPHRGAGVCILARADVAVGGESGVGEGEFHMVANEAWGRFFPPAAEGDFVGDAYAARCLPSILLAG